MVANAGPYTLKGKTLTETLQNSSNPGAVGGEAQAEASVSGNTLVFTFTFANAFMSLATMKGFGRPLVSRGLQNASVWLAWIGVALAGIAILANEATVLFTFYTPMQATSWFYIGAVLLVVTTAAAVGYAMASLLPPMIALLLSQVLVFGVLAIGANAGAISEAGQIDLSAVFSGVGSI